MSGHNKWSKIKHKKAKTDAQKSRLFAKHIRVITVEAQKDPNLEFNPRLKNAVDRAKEDNVPAERIKNAIDRANESAENMESLLFESYGPGGVAILIEAITDNRNRTVSEVKKILDDNFGKWAEPGSVGWAFNQSEKGWIAKFPQKIIEKEEKQLEKLILALMDHDDVQSVFHNVQEQ